MKIELGDWDAMRDEARAIRYTVFVEEQCVPVELEWDDFDAQCVHAIARDAHGQAQATGRLLPDGHIGRMAVLAAARGQGVGSEVLLALMECARHRGDASVALNAQTHALAFYARHGFVAEGEEFFEAGIAHIAMRCRFAAP
jgi:predicted GNAT family N-acyltransferase